MMKKVLKITLFLILVSFPGFVTVGYGQLKKCTICHGKPDLKKVLPDGKVKSLYVDEAQISGSVHAKKRCSECHLDITEIPHRGEIKRVDCTHCHYKGNPEGAPQADLYMEYSKSVHGKALASGNPKAPLCQDCHGSHDIRLHTDPESRVYKLRIHKDCGRCHYKIFTQYITSIHGQAIEKNIIDAPTCTDCHGEHNIKAPEDAESMVYVINIPKTCPKCHAAEGIVGKYGISTDQVTTYEESYHGIAIKYGVKIVANCASCHGIHDVRPPTDPKSSVYIDNIPETCGKCHPGANINYAKGKIHVEPKKRESGVIYYVSTFFKWLTITVMLGLIAHIILDLTRKIREKYGR